MKPEWLIEGGFAAAAAYDAYALINDQETISACVRRHTEQPWQKFLLTGFMGGLLVHFLLPPVNLTPWREYEASETP